MTLPLMDAFSFSVQRFQFESANETGYAPTQHFMQLSLLIAVKIIVGSILKYEITIREAPTPRPEPSTKPEKS